MISTSHLINPQSCKARDHDLIDWSTISPALRSGASVLRAQVPGSAAKTRYQMSIQYVLKPESDLLTVKTRGFDENLQEVEQYGLAILEACQEGNYSRVLCDETELEYRLGTLDTYQSAVFLASYAPRLIKAAIVCNEKFVSDAHFWETVAANRGLTVRVFKDVESARHWLHEQ